jgi:hypothetical protein
MPDRELVFAVHQGVLLPSQPLKVGFTKKRQMPPYRAELSATMSARPAVGKAWLPTSAQECARTPLEAAPRAAP